jgi:hypothetical protein
MLPFLVPLLLAAGGAGIGALGSEKGHRLSGALKGAGLGAAAGALGPAALASTGGAAGAGGASAFAKQALPILSSLMGKQQQQQQLPFQPQGIQSPAVGLQPYNPMNQIPRVNFRGGF